jgi:hypothetical protein
MENSAEILEYSNKVEAKLVDIQTIDQGFISPTQSTEGIEIIADN